MVLYMGEELRAVDINGTCTHHGVAAADCPYVHRGHHHLAIISGLAIPSLYPSSFPQLLNTYVYTTGAVHTLREIISNVKRVVTASNCRGRIISTAFQHVRQLKQ
jgi:hypothetical protein